MNRAQPEALVIKENPPITIFGRDFCKNEAYDFDEAPIYYVAVGTGRLAVNLTACPIEERHARAGIIAALGVGYPTAAKYFNPDREEFRDRIKVIFNEMTVLKKMPVAKQAHLPLCFLEEGIFSVTAAVPELRLSERQLEIAKGLVIGKSTREIAAELSTPERLVYNSGVKSSVGGIADNNGWRGTTEISLAVLMSGQVGSFVSQQAKAVGAQLHYMATHPAAPPTTP